VIVELAAAEPGEPAVREQHAALALVWFVHRRASERVMDTTADQIWCTLAGGWVANRL
jgi:hypothetical protein